MSKEAFSKIFMRKYNQYLSNIDRNRKRYTVDPERQIRSGGKVMPSEVIRIMTTMVGGTIDDALWNAGSDYSVPAFVKQRDRLHTDVMRDTIRWVHKHGTRNLTWRGFHVLACDGTDVQISAESIPEDQVIHQQGHSYGMMHLNAVYDVCNDLYVDVSAVPKKGEGEIAQLISLIQTGTYPHNPLFVCDRGYCSISLMRECLMAGYDICIRARTQWFKFIQNLPDENLDLVKTFRFSRHATKANRELQRKGELTIIHYSDATFDEDFSMDLRIIKFQLSSGIWETLVTTVTDQTRLTTKHMKELYHMRWGVETSFRTLKHRIALSGVHAKKLHAVTLEMYAKVLSYNLCMTLIYRADISQHQSRYALRINLSKGIIRVLSFLRAKDWRGPPIEHEIAKHVVPVRPDKPNPKRNPRVLVFVPCMQYRAA